MTINTGKRLVWNLTSPRSQLWLALKRGPLDGMPFEQLADLLPEVERQAVSNTLQQMAGLGVINKPTRRGGLFNLNPVGPVPQFVTGGDDPAPTADDAPPPPTPGAALQSWLSPGVDLGPKRPLRTAAEAAAEQTAPVATPAPPPQADRKSTPAPAQTPSHAGVGMYVEHLHNPPSSLGLRTRRTGPAAGASAPDAVFEARIGMAPLPVQGETVNDQPDTGFVCALFSNGKLQLQVNGQVITLSLEHTRQLMHYLDHMDGGAVVSDAHRNAQAA